ncbi:MAG: winged helix-turn-helix transcriptional regulator [Gammaproteobacteria bacterium]
MDPDKDQSLTLEILSAIEADHRVTQRRLADHLGVALGLTNVYLKRCVRKGWVKISEAPANRYMYYLTPKGFAAKARLTGEFLSYSLGFYRRASDAMEEILASCETAGLDSICLVGRTELAEIASVRAQEHAVRLVCTYDPEARGEAFVGRPIYARLADVPECAACVVTMMRPAPRLLDTLAARWPRERILVSPLVASLVTPQEAPGRRGAPR